MNTRKQSCRPAATRCRSPGAVLADMARRGALLLALTGLQASAGAYPNVPFYENFTYADGTSINGVNSWKTYTAGPGYGVLPAEYHGWQGWPGGAASAADGEARLAGISLLRTFGTYTGEPGTGWPATTGQYDKAPLVTVRYRYEPDNTYSHDVTPTVWSKYNNMFSTTRWSNESRGSYYTMMTTVRFFVKKDGRISAYDGHRIKHLAHTPISGPVDFTVTADYINRTWSLWLNDEQVVSNYGLYKTHKNATMIHDGWYKDYDGLKEIGFVDASTNSATRIDHVRVFEGTREARSLPFIENFETRTVGGQLISMTPGSLNGQNYWFSNGSTVATAAQNTDPASSGSQGTQIPGGKECFQLFLDGRTEVWSDFWMKPFLSGNGDVVVDAGGGDAVYQIDTSGNIRAYNGSNASIVATVNPAQWTRFTVHTAYASRTWSLLINGATVAAGLGFRETASGDSYQEFRVSSTGTAVTYVDDISLSLSTPFLKPTVSFQSASASLGENATLVTVTAVLDRAYGSQVRVDYALQSGGSATSGSDFSFSSGTLIFAPGETSKSFSLTVVNDTDNEEEESFTLQLLNPVNATLGSITQRTYTIQPDPADWKNIPFYEPFESRTTGSLNGQRGWTSHLVDVQTATRFQGTKAALGNRTGSLLAHPFTNGVTRVVTQWRAIPVFAQQAPTPPAGSTFAFYVNASGRIVAYNGAIPVTMGSAVTLVSGQWAHFVVSTDHNEKTWSLKVNGVVLGSGLNFFSGESASYREFGVQGPVTLDELSIGFDTALPPGDLTARALNAHVILSWSASQGAQTYNVRRATSPGGTYTTIGSTAGTSYTDTTAANNTTYYYTVAAVNGSGEGSPSAAVSGTPRAEVTGVAAASGIGHVNLTWDGFAGATGYIVRRSTTAGGPYTSVATPAGTSYSDTAVVNGTVYYYRIAAQTPVYVSTDSAQVVGTPNLRTIFYDSFESPDITGRPERAIPGWKTTLIAGASDPRAGLWDEGTTSMTTPFGAQAAYVWNDRMITTTNIMEQVREGVTYTLTFNAAAEFGQGGIRYKVELMGGGTVLNSVLAAWDVDTHDFTARSERIDFTVPAGHPAIGQPLGIRLRYESGDWHYVIGYDNVRLAANEEAPPVLPSPMTFASAPAANSSISAVMTASPTTSGVAPINYWFENVETAANSGWITGPGWTHTNLKPGASYGYRVKARDVYGNESSWSSVLATTPVDSVVGAPDVGLGGGPSSYQQDAGTLRGELLSGGAALVTMCWGTADAGTVSTSAWPNRVTVGAVYSGQQFSANLTGLSPSTTYHYRVHAVNAAGEDWSEAASFTTPGPANVITGVTGGNDSWNTASNWTYGHAPTGSEAAVIQAGITAKVNNAATPVYSGGLTIGANSTLQVGSSVTTGNVNALGTGSIVMNSGSVIIASHGLGTYTFTQPFVLAGNATIWAAISTVNNNITKTFAGGISGPGRLTYNGVNNSTFVFNTNNASWTGGFQSANPENERHQVKAAANGAFGTGDVKINQNCSLQIQAGLGDAISNTAALHLTGTSSPTLSAKLVLDSNETVNQLWIDGVQQPAGDYSSGETWLDGSGILTVLRGPAVPTLIIFR